MDQIKSVIVVGASAGGLPAISQLLEKIPKSLKAAVFVVLHLSRQSEGSVLVNHLQKKTSFKCGLAEDGEPVREGQVYIAKPDFHMLLTQEGVIRVIKGPHENRWRPSIDVLFRSAAASYSSKVVGVVLTGMLDDGTSGMLSIKRCGGICIVQEPDEAEFSDMPDNVLSHVDVDYRVPIADIGYILDDMKSKPSNPNISVPEDIQLEAEMTEKMISDMDDLKKIGTQSNFTCPDCGGTLFSINQEKFSRYRCFTGHVYTEKLLLDKQSESLEESLWITVRKLEERKKLLTTSAKNSQTLNKPELQADKLEKAKDIDANIERLKALIVSLSISDLENAGYE